LLHLYLLDDSTYIYFLLHIFISINFIFSLFSLSPFLSLFVLLCSLFCFHFLSSLYIALFIFLKYFKQSKCLFLAILIHVNLSQQNPFSCNHFKFSKFPLTAACQKKLGFPLKTSISASTCFM
jgi:hypothetical protein